MALDVAEALSGGSSAAVLAAALLSALLGLVADFLKQARVSEYRAELLLAQLEDAREEQTRAAAIAEHGRIASELHDVLAHSLSGATIQLQGARRLAEREEATPQIRTAIDRASQLVKDGLADARQAVDALRGEELPGVAQLEPLIESFRDDLEAEVTLSIEGNARTLPADASLAAGRPNCGGLAGRAGRTGMTEGPIRVLIADDQRVVRDGLTMLVGLIDGVEIVGTAGDGIAAVQRALHEHPDVVLMDLRMPELEGAEATRQIRATLPGTQVLVLKPTPTTSRCFPHSRRARADT